MNKKYKLEVVKYDKDGNEIIIKIEESNNICSQMLREWEWDNRKANIYLGLNHVRNTH